MDNPCLAEPIGLFEIFGMSGHRKDWNRARDLGLLQRTTEFKAVHSWNRQIGQDDVRPELLRLRQRLMAIVRVNNPEAAATEVIPVHHAGAEIVLDDQHQWCFRHLPPVHRPRLIGGGGAGKSADYAGN